MYEHELKLERALQHLRGLDTAVKKRVEGNPYRVSDKFHPWRSENVVWVTVLQQPPSDLRLTVGDCLHNLRSGLDALAYELALSHTGDPLPDNIAEKSAFPIFGEKAMTASQRKRYIGGIDPSAQAIIEGLQPYKRGQDYTSDPLWVLYELSNIDKHRLPP